MCIRDSINAEYMGQFKRELEEDWSHLMKMRKELKEGRIPKEEEKKDDFQFVEGITFPESHQKNVVPHPLSCCLILPLFAQFVVLFDFFLCSFFFLPLCFFINLLCLIAIFLVLSPPKREDESRIPDLLFDKIQQSIASDFFATYMCLSLIHI
eukprot:TRINITY_DN16662_c0_g1_i2.p1 TRINITY_DN16662_c0_g1~~TRINITY_DN16662_c0_g1_i2.p1  ORF type:complete len:172 (-),score=38.22 TRINITY_DN16662_c0_g1_i2:61-519(-)